MPVTNAATITVITTRLAQTVGMWTRSGTAGAAVGMGRDMPAHSVSRTPRSGDPAGRSVNWIGRLDRSAGQVP
jgi:hypothetical protein